MNNSGFTLIEIIVSLALITVITGAGLPAYVSFQTGNDLDVAAVTIAQTERRAQALARASDGESDWGVAVMNGTITLFKGEEYAERDSAFDETFDMPSSITPSGESQIVFARYSGFPTAVGTITLTSNNGSVRIIGTNEMGTITY